MIRTIISILVTFAIIIGLSIYEMYYVHTTFHEFSNILQAVQTKTALHTATIEDGYAVREFWDREKQQMHVWIPHTTLQEVHYQLDEAIGFLATQSYEDALAKFNVLLGIADCIPRNYTLGIENIF